MGYVLSTERMRVAVKNERGTVIRRKVFRKGDAVTQKDLEHLEGRFAALVASGALVDENTDLSEDANGGIVQGHGLGNSTATTPVAADLGFTAEGGDLPDGVTLNDDGSMTLSPEWAERLRAAAAEGEFDGEDGEGEDDEEEPSPEDQFDPAKVEDFETMDYPTLQRLAKARTGSGAGGKDDLIARLEAHAAEARTE